jgi:hypothetical protein
VSTPPIVLVPGFWLGHWPMWSRPQELAEIIGGIAKGASEP